MNRFAVMLTLLTVATVLGNAQAHDPVVQDANVTQTHRTLQKEKRVTWGGAAVAWKNRMERLSPRIHEAEHKEEYYQCYFFYIKCLGHYAVTYQNPKLNAQELAAKMVEYIERAAKLIIKVEETEPANMGSPGLKEQYAELLKVNPPLKKEYDKAKAAAPAAGN